MALLHKSLYMTQYVEAKQQKQKIIPVTSHNETKKLHEHDMLAGIWAGVDVSLAQGRAFR